MDSLHYRKWGGYFKGTKIPDGMETVSGAVVKIMESFISLTPSVRLFLRHLLLLRSSTQWSPLYFFPLGPYLNDVYKIFGILDPLRLHSGQIPSTKITKPPLLCLHLGTPPP